MEETDRKQHGDALDFHDIANIMYLALNAVLEVQADHDQDKQRALVMNAIIHARQIYRQGDLRDEIYWERGIDNCPWSFKVSAPNLQEKRRWQTTSSAMTCSK